MARRVIAAVALACAFAPAASAAIADARPQTLTERVRLIDGQRVNVVTHGDELAPLQQLQRTAARAALSFRPSVAALGAGPADHLTSAWCPNPVSQTTDRANTRLGKSAQIKVVYAYASDRPNRFAQYANLLQGTARESALLVANATGGGKTLRFDIGSACGDDRVDIQTVQLPQARSYYFDGTTADFYRVANAVKAASPAPAGEPRDWLIFADDMPTGAAGQGEVTSDTRPSAANAHNVGGFAAIVWGRGGADFMGGTVATPPTWVALHEVFHNLGAVQLNAPHKSASWHCTDEWDLMCYSDGPGVMVTYPCASEPVNYDAIDCGNDDYFNAAPAAGTYLATNWNTYNSAFLCSVGSCDGAAQPTARLQVSSGYTDEPVTFDASASTGPQAIETYQWDFDADGTIDRTTATSSTQLRLSAGTRQARVTVTAGAGSAVSDLVAYTVASRPPVAQLVVDPAPTGKATVFDASASTPQTAIILYRWDFDGDGVVDKQTSTARTAYTYVSAGTRAARVQVVDNAGVTATSAWVTVTIGTQPPGAALDVTSAGAGALTLLDASRSSGNLPIVWFEFDTDGDGRYDAAGARPQLERGYDPGPHSARVRVTDGSGASAESEMVSFTVAGEQLKPRIRLADAPRTGATITFDGRASSGNVDSWAWDLGVDGRIDGDEPTFTAKFVKAGTFRLRLTVRDDAGQTAKTDLSFTVDEDDPFSLSLQSTPRRQAAASIGRGIAVRAQSSSRAQTALALTVSRAQARKLGLRAGDAAQVQIGKATVTTTSVPRTIRVKVTAAARRALRRSGRLVKVRISGRSRNGGRAASDTADVTIVRR